ncbi:hypothetical protein [Gilvibacter sp.]|uniref:hypothetical protein n=1 Tax=Gilvibacter sp. TaxID=2729997 RepID=UPI0025BF93BD|nr:hypothetical protein [Gilvibacter sp.]NQX77535.1 hypothetical protein [Gilvibacter sp.]
MNKKITIGIDPSVTSTKFAYALVDWKFKTATIGVFRDFFEFQDFVLEVKGKEGVRAAVDNSNAQNMSFDMKGSKAVVARKARNVGRNQERSELCIGWLDKLGIPNRGVKPSSSGTKKSEGYILGRLRAEDITLVEGRLARYTKGKDQGSLREDVRDALELALDWA